MFRQNINATKPKFGLTENPTRNSDEKIPNGHRMHSLVMMDLNKGKEISMRHLIKVHTISWRNMTSGQSSYKGDLCKTQSSSGEQLLSLNPQYPVMGKNAVSISSTTSWGFVKRLGAPWQMTIDAQSNWKKLEKELLQIN